jgi:putative ATP-binding cassette transporter
MNLWRVLVRFGGWRLGVSVIGGLIGGAALAALMRLVHVGLTLPSTLAGKSALEFVSLLAVYFAGTVLSERALGVVAERFEWELRNNLTRQILAMPLRELERIGAPHLFGVLSVHVKTVSAYLCWLPSAVINLAIVVGCFGYIAWLSPVVFGLNMVFLALAAGCYLVPERAAVRVGRAANKIWDRHVGQIHYLLAACRLLLLSRAKRQDFLTNHFEPAGMKVRELNARYRLIHLIAERFAEVLVLGNLACLLFVLPRFMALSVGTLTGLLLAGLFVRPSLKSLLDFFPKTQGARLALAQMSEANLKAFEQRPEELPVPNPAPGFSQLVFDRVTFSYENDHDQSGFSSGPFSFQIKAGEIVFLIGGNGAGKTTLAKLICGLYSPISGSISVDGVIVENDEGRSLLQARIAAVFTEDPLFSHVLGVPPSEVEKMGPSLLKEFRLSDKVSLLGTEFSSTDLSQGQRRRLSLTNALLEDRPILVLDEWAADQDPEFRHFFYEHFLPGLRKLGKTIILITHDDRYFGKADRLIKLDGGRLAREKDLVA